MSIESENEIFWKSKIKQCKLKLYYRTKNIKLTFKANLVGKC